MYNRYLHTYWIQNSWRFVDILSQPESKFGESHLAKHSQRIQSAEAPEHTKSTAPHFPWQVIRVKGHTFPTYPGGPGIGTLPYSLESHRKSSGMWHFSSIFVAFSGVHGSFAFETSPCMPCFLLFKHWCLQTTGSTTIRLSYKLLNRGHFLFEFATLSLLGSAVRQNLESEVFAACSWSAATANSEWKKLQGSMDAAISTRHVRHL